MVLPRMSKSKKTKVTVHEFMFDSLVFFLYHGIKGKLGVSWGSGDTGTGSRSGGHENCSRAGVLDHLEFALSVPKFQPI